jgi:hypothetical protein
VLVQHLFQKPVKPLVLCEMVLALGFLTGHVDRDSVVDSVPRCLVELVLIIEHGPDIKSQIENGLAKSDFAIAQLLYFNNHKKGTKNTSEHSRHSSEMAGQTTSSSIN